MSRKTVVALLGACVVGLTLSAAGVAQSQAPAARYGAKGGPKNAFGQPDLTGVWSNATSTPVERPAQFGDRLILTEAEAAKVQGDAEAYRAAGDVPTDPNAPAPTDRNTNAGYNRGWTDPGTMVMRVDGKARSSFLTTPNGRVPPRKAGAPRPLGAGVSQLSEADRGPSGSVPHPESRGLPERCIHMPTTAGPVMRPVLYNNNYYIAQSRDSVLIWVEMIHDLKVVRIGGKHRTDGVREWMGDSIGWYEGDTLVVETINYHPSQTFYGASPNVKVTERFRRVSPDRLFYQFKVEDPAVWDVAWGGEYEFWASPGIFEYACHEGNYGLYNILAGARQEEQAAARR